MDSNSASCSSLAGLAIPCDDTAECSGQFCCGLLDVNNDVYTAIQCQATCDPAQNQIVFCDPTAVPDVCASIPDNNGPPYTCGESTLLPGFYRCTNGT